MAYQIRDKVVLEELKHLAEVRRMTVADVLRDVVKKEAEREYRKLSVRERLEPILAKASASRTLPPKILSPDAEKQEFDELWED